VATKKRTKSAARTVRMEPKPVSLKELAEHLGLSPATVSLVMNRSPVAMSIPAAQLEEHRSALTGHCYRMMGSAVDADDAVQETMVRAWRSLDRFDAQGREREFDFIERHATRVDLLQSQASL